MPNKFDKILGEYREADTLATGYIINNPSAGDANIVQLVNNTTVLLGTTSAGGGGDTKIGQSFTLANTTTIVGVFVYTGANSGTPLGNVTCRIETIVGGVPSGTLVDSGATATLTNQEFVENTTNYFLFDSFDLAAGTYAIVLQCDTQTTNKGWNVKNSSTDQYAGGNQFAKIGAGAWTAQTSKDLMFTLDTGGVTDNIIYEKSTDPVWTVGLDDDNGYDWYYGSAGTDLKATLYPNGNLYLLGNIGVGGLPTSDDLRVYGYSNLSAIRAGQDALSPAIIFIGDSITVGTFGGGNAWTTDVNPDLYGGDIAWTKTNLGIPSATIKNLRHLVPSYNDYIAYDEGLNIAMVWAGTNDLADGDAVSQTYGYYESVCKQLRNAGYKVIATTTISRASIEVPVNLKDQYNLLIRSNWSDFADILADIAGDALLGADGAYANTTYFFDGVHPTQAGNDLISAMVQLCVDSLTDEHDVHIAGKLAIGKLFPDEKLDVKGNVKMSGTATGSRFISSVATGTSPYTCTSTTVNTNLNADLWDGYQFADYLDQAVKTTSNPTFGNITATSIIIGANTLNTTEWAFLDGLDQAVKTTSNVQHAKLGIGLANTAYQGIDILNAQAQGIRLGNLRTDSSNKEGRVVGVNYDTDALDSILFGFSNTVGANEVRIGGGYGTGTCATVVNFRAGADSTTAGAGTLTFSYTSALITHSIATLFSGQVNTGAAVKTYLGNTGTPTAVLHLKGGSATAGSSSLKIDTNSGAFLATHESGAIVYDGSYLYITNSTPTISKILTEITSTALNPQFNTLGLGTGGNGTDAVYALHGTAGGFFTTSSLADTTTKQTRWSMNAYNLANAVMSIFGCANTASQNSVRFGGGDGTKTAATNINFYAAPDQATLGGTIQLTVHYGDLTIGASTDLIKAASSLGLDIQNATASTFAIQNSTAGQVCNFTIDGTIQPAGTGLVMASDQYVFVSAASLTSGLFFNNTGSQIELRRAGAMGFYMSTADRSIGAYSVFKLYNNIATEDYGVPAIVDGVALTAQGASIGSTNFTGGDVAGLYRCNYYLECTTLNAGDVSIQLTVGWTDDAGATTTSSAALILTALGRTSGIFYIQLASGNITYLTTFTGAAARAKYALYMDLERLK